MTFRLVPSKTKSEEILHPNVGFASFFNFLQVFNLYLELILVFWLNGILNIALKNPPGYKGY